MVSFETWSFALKTKKQPVPCPWNNFSETLVMPPKHLSTRWQINDLSPICNADLQHSVGFEYQ